LTQLLIQLQLQIASYRQPGPEYPPEVHETSTQDRRERYECFRPLLSFLCECASRDARECNGHQNGYNAQRDEVMKKRPRAIKNSAAKILAQAQYAKGRENES
jgi:hypothetical protein